MRAFGGGSGIAEATSVPDGDVKGFTAKDASCSGDPDWIREEMAAPSASLAPHTGAGWLQG